MIRLAIKKKYTYAAALCLAAIFVPLQVKAGTCEAADILFGPVRLDIVEYDGYETAIVRSATFDDPLKIYGAILGELTVDRGGFAIRNVGHVVVGTISPDLKIEGWDDACNLKRGAEIIPVKEGTYIILNDGQPVGTIVGRFPENGFGVK